MKTLSVAMISACAVLAIASGCTVGEASEEDIAQGEQALCENKDGVNAVQTALAVAAANEMHRWLPMRDFQWNSSTGKLELSSYGVARCPGTACPNTRAMLAMQNAPANTVRFPGGIYLNPTTLKNTLKQDWIDQTNCVNAGTCPQETYDLFQTNWEFGSCDVKYFFNAFKQGTSTQVTDTASLTGLNDNLVFLGYPENKMLNFYIRNGQPSVDPTGGLNEGGTTTSGSCAVACSKYSATSLAGQCCSCEGVTKTFKVSSFSSAMFLCQ